MLPLKVVRSPSKNEPAKAIPSNWMSFFEPLITSLRFSRKVISQENHQEAQKMLAWLKAREIKQTSSRQIQQFGNFRDKTKREEAISILLDHNYLAENTENGKKVLFVNPM